MYYKWNTSVCMWPHLKSTVPKQHTEKWVEKPAVIASSWLHPGSLSKNSLTHCLVNIFSLCSVFLFECIHVIALCGTHLKVIRVVVWRMNKKRAWGGCSNPAYLHFAHLSSCCRKLVWCHIVGFRKLLILIPSSERCTLTGTLDSLHCTTCTVYMSASSAITNRKVWDRETWREWCIRSIHILRVLWYWYTVCLI